MAKSLAEQLASAGLVNANKAKKVSQEQRKKAKLKRKGHMQDEVQAEEARKQQLREQQKQQAERDRHLNQQRKKEAEEKAKRAQAMQMLQHGEQNISGEIAFNFVDPRSNKVKQLWVNKKGQTALAAGQLAICADADSYKVVPTHVAEKVMERYPEALMFLAQPEAHEVAEDDPYKDYQIPDDLMW